MTDITMTCAPAGFDDAITMNTSRPRSHRPASIQQTHFDFISLIIDRRFRPANCLPSPATTPAIGSIALQYSASDGMLRWPQGVLAPYLTSWHYHYFFDADDEIVDFHALISFVEHRSISREP